MRQTSQSRRTPANRPNLIENLETRRLLATFTVDSLGDTSAADGVTTLREAVVASEASAGADQIVFDPTVFAGAQSILLTNGQLNITQPLTITDSVGGVTIDANDNGRHINLTSGSLTLNGLVFTNANLPVVMDTRDAGGSILGATGTSITATGTNWNSNEGGDGGAIFTNGNLTLTDAVFEDNVGFDPDSASSGGAIGMFGAAATLTVTGGSFDGNVAQDTTVGGGTGGAIRAQIATVTINGTTFTDNTGEGSGGALFFVTDTVNVMNSTFTNNRTGPSGNYGGGIYAVDDGTVEHILNVTNSTFTDGFGADAGGGIAAFGPTVNVNGSTFTNNTAQFQQDSADQNFVTGSGGAIEVRLNLGTIPAEEPGPLGTGLSITDTIIDNNTAGSDGGAVTFIGNTSLLPAAISAGNPTTPPSGGSNVQNTTADARQFADPRWCCRRSARERHRSSRFEHRSQQRRRSGQPDRPTREDLQCGAVEHHGLEPHQQLRS